MVRDAERAANWYTEVFGLRRWMDTPFTLSGRQLATGERGDQTRLIIMAGEHDSLGMIGLLEWLVPRRAPEPAPSARLEFGMPIFVVSGDDANATCERARAAGSQIHCEPYCWTVTGADGRDKEMIGTSFFDLDGYFFEVNQVVRYL